MDRFTYSSAPQRKVKTLQFGVLDAEFLVSGGGRGVHPEASRLALPALPCLGWAGLVWGLLCCAASSAARPLQALAARMAGAAAGACSAVTCQKP